MSGSLYLGFETEGWATQLRLGLVMAVCNTWGLHIVKVFLEDGMVGMMIIPDGTIVTKSRRLPDLRMVGGPLKVGPTGTVFHQRSPTKVVATRLG